MTDFEDRLKSALVREQPSADFTNRVLAQVQRVEQERLSRWKPWAAGCIAASLLIGGFGLADMDQRRDREQAQSAHAKLVRALEITSAKLQRIQRRVDGINQ